MMLCQEDHLWWIQHAELRKQKLCWQCCHPACWTIFLLLQTLTSSNCAGNCHVFLWRIWDLSRQVGSISADTTPIGFLGDFATRGCPRRRSAAGQSLNDRSMPMVCFCDRVIMSNYTYMYDICMTLFDVVFWCLMLFLVVRLLKPA